ncbi:Cystathionine beta-lyase [hydrothermal vent metagenome]|uniref:cysteine-S-conjugate beta-lyase n=1 Tax=hydrothermal vent metagenome TaxID=652676 RepID=A0A3B0SA07_9ZZZZ
MTALVFDFDKEIDRRAVPALKWHPMVLGADGADLFPAGVADMDFRAPPPVITALQQRLDHGVFGYETVPEGLMPALIGWLQTRHDWQVDPGHILRAPNVLDSLAIAASLFTGPGDGIIVQPPVFFDFFDIITENHRIAVNNPLVLRDGRYEMDFGGLERLAADPRNRMLYLCNPHNPVGRVWTRDELGRLDAICRHHDVLVISDEIHGDITFDGHAYTPFATLGISAALNSITCISPAKSFNIASCCSAFTVITDDTRRRAFQAENSRLTVNKNNAFASVAMQAAYRDGAPWLEAVIAYLDGNLSLLRTRLADLPAVTLIEPEGTFLVWLDFNALGFAPDDLTAFLRQKAGWAVTRGISFGLEGAGFARLNIACTRAKLNKALDRLSSALIEHTGITTTSGEPQ